MAGGRPAAMMVMKCEGGFSGNVELGNVSWELPANVRPTSAGRRPGADMLYQRQARKKETLC